MRAVALARAESAPLLAVGIRHPDIGVRAAAATAVRDVSEAAAEAIESLAEYAADPPSSASRTPARMRRGC